MGAASSMVFAWNVAQGGTVQSQYRATPGGSGVKAANMATTGWIGGTFHLAMGSELLLDSFACAFTSKIRPRPFVAACCCVRACTCVARRKTPVHGARPMVRPKKT